MKKIFALAACLIAGTAMAAFAGCNPGAENLGPGSGGLGGGAGTQAEAGAKSAYALGAVTTAGLLAGNTAVASPVSLMANVTVETTPEQGTQTPEQGTQTPEQGTQTPEQSTQTPEQGTQVPEQGGTSGEMQETVTDFNEYFTMLDAFLNEDAVKVEVTENSDEAYAFEYKMTVEGTLPDGKTQSYTMYYTETEVRSHEEQEDDEVERSVAYELTGVLEMGGVSYEMTGYRMSETETEGREEEKKEELWIMASDPSNAGNYVRMNVETEQETEGQEQEAEREYVYSVYRDGRLAERTTLSFETENEDGENETEYELSIVKEGKTSRFEVEREQVQSGATVIGVKYQAEGKSGRFVITKTADGNVYTFEDDSHLTLDDWDDEDD